MMVIVSEYCCTSFPCFSLAAMDPLIRNDWALLSKIDYRDSRDDRFYLSLNWNRFDSMHFVLRDNGRLGGIAARVGFALHR